MFSAGFIGNGIVEEIEELSPPWPQRILMGVEGTEDAMLDCSLCDFVAMMQRSFYVCCTGALQAVADGVMVRKTPFGSHFYIKTIILPRQARDKHRES